MKKGLLTLLAASLVFVGCQNYDDQFDDLNAQISALKSQVDGLSALSGQVSALSGSISGLQSGIAASASSAQMTALSASLTALQAEVDAIEAAIATTATASEVTALQTSLTALETDLADLLTSNNVYATAITVNSAASMASALALGNKVALMNAAVTITDDATISDTDIQTFINRIKTMNGTFTYDSGSATGFTPTFDEMVAATALAITPAGPVSFKKLASATTVVITTTYSTKITSLDMSALASVTSFNTGTVDQLHLTSATNVDLGALPRYGAALSIQTKKGATLDIAALDDKSTTGAQSDLALTLNGPASATLSLIADGTITLTNVATATVSNFYGTLDIKGGVETLTTTDSVFIDLDSASDLVTATLDFKADWDPALTTANAAISAAGYSTTYLEDYSATGSIIAADLKTLTITGDLLDLYLDEANLETLSINANMTDLTMSSLTDLTSLTVAGGKIGNITLTGSNNLTVANFDHTSNMENKGSATANKSVTLSVTDNTSLTKLHSTGDDVDTLTITGNTALAELDFTGLADDGSETTPTPAVTIWGNALVAVSAANTTDGETDRADGLATDLGSFDDGTSGMDTLKTYLTHMAATAGTTAFVTFDTLQTETDTETTGTTSTTLNVADAGDGSTTNEATVLKMSPAVAAVSNATPATQGKEAFAFTTLGTLQFAVNGVNIPASPLALTGNSAVDAANLATTANLNLATAAGVTMTAADTYGSYIEVLLIDYANNYSGSPTGERYTAAQLTAAVTDTGDVFETGHSDEFTLTITDTSGVTNTVTASLGGQSVTGSAIADIEEAIVKAWEAKYGAAGTASWTAIATMLDSGTGTLDIRMLQEDSGGNGAAVSFSVADKAQVSGLATQTSANIDYKIGATLSSSDNTTKSTDTSNAGLIVTFESSLSGVTDTVLTGITSSVANTAAVLASSTDIRTSYSTATGITSYAATGYPRTDVRNVEAAVASTATGTAQTLFNRVAWLG